MEEHRSGRSKPKTHALGALDAESHMETMQEKSHVFLYELLGTMFFTSIIIFGAYSQGSGVTGSGTGSSAQSIATGSTIFYWIIALGYFIATQFATHLSGAHLNPAVSLAVVIGRFGGEFFVPKFFVMLLCYWLPQFIGTILGFLIPRFIIGDAIMLPSEAIADALNAMSKAGASDSDVARNYNMIRGVGFAYYPFDNNSLTGFLMEFWGTFLFTLVFLIVSHPKTHHSKVGTIKGLIISLAYFTAISLSFRASGGCLNPALGLGLNLMSKISYSNDWAFPKVWLYIVAPLAGALLSGLLFHFFHLGQLEQINEDQSDGGQGAMPENELGAMPNTNHSNNFSAEPHSKPYSSGEGHHDTKYSSGYGGDSHHDSRNVVSDVNHHGNF